MIRIKIENLPKRNLTKFRNRFTMSVGSVYDRYEFATKFYLIDFYLNPSKDSDKPLRYVRFVGNKYLNEVADKVYMDLNYLPQDHPALTKGFSIELFLRKLRASMFDERLTHINFFVTKKECLDFSLKLINLVDKETAKDYDIMENFLTSNLTFLYLLS